MNIHCDLNISKSSTRAIPAPTTASTRCEPVPCATALNRRVPELRRERNLRFDVLAAEPTRHRCAALPGDCDDLVAQEGPTLTLRHRCQFTPVPRQERSRRAYATREGVQDGHAQIPVRTGLRK